MAASGVENPSQNDKWWCQTDAKVVPFSYMWTIYDFSLHDKNPNECLKSSLFSVGNDEQTQLELSVFPRGVKENQEEVYLAVYLSIVSPNYFQVRTDFQISILNAKNEKKHTVKSTKMSRTTSTITGLAHFIARQTVMDEDNELLPDDSLTFFCEGSATLEKTIHTSGKSDSVQEFEVPECAALSELGHLLENGKFTDITISARDEEIQAHKAILAARSTVFSAMFNCPMEEAKKNRVEITDIDSKVIKEMLRFIYAGKAPNLKEMAGDLIIAADKYDLGRLKVMCAETLFMTLTTDNAAEILILADRHSEKQLKAQTIEFINNYLKHVVNTTNYVTMTDSHPHLIKEILCASTAIQKNSECISHEVYNQRNTF